MKTPLLPLATAALALLATGCTSVDPSVTTAARIQEKHETFARMTPRAQQAVQSGAIERGFTSEMVYMALGQPAKVRTKDAPIGKLEMWTYVIFAPQRVDAKDNLNNPGTRKYTPMLTYVNAPVIMGQPEATLPVGFGLGAGGPMQPLDVPDLKQERLYVFFANDRVAEIKYDSGS